MKSMQMATRASETVVNFFGGKHSARGRAASVGASTFAAVGSFVAGPVGAVVGAAVGGAVAVVIHEKF